MDSFKHIEYPGTASERIVIICDRKKFILKPDAGMAAAGMLAYVLGFVEEIQHV